MKNMGETLRTALQEENILVTHLAEKLFGNKKSSKTLYNWFKKNGLSRDKIERVVNEEPRVAKYFPELFTTPTSVSEPSLKYGDIPDYKKIAMEWEQKYYITLGKLTECQEQIKRV